MSRDQQPSCVGMLSQKVTRDWMDNSRHSVPFPSSFTRACLTSLDICDVLYRVMSVVLNILKTSFKTSRFQFFEAVFSNQYWPHLSGYHLRWIHQSTLFCYELLHSISFLFLRLSITILPPEPDLILSTTKCQAPARGAPVGAMLEAVSHLADCLHSARGVWVDTASFPPFYPPPLSHPGTLASPSLLPIFLSDVLLYLALCVVLSPFCHNARTQRNLSERSRTAV